MKKIVSVISVFIIALMMSACGGASLTPEQQSVIDSQTTVYTQVSMWTEKNRVIGTNYARGLHIPVNTKVKIVKMNSKVIVFEHLGVNISYLIYSKYTKVDLDGMYNRLFSTKAVDLSKYSAAVKENIKIGEVVVGMSKDEVLLARGYPPFHKTASVKADLWKYWDNRFKTSIITFKDNRVISIL